MRLHGQFSIGAIVAASAMAMVAVPSQQALGPSTEVVNASEVKRRRSRLLAPSAYGYPASKNKPPKRKLRRNRLHLSRRTRARHRRARKAA